mmetsp:Transcript_16971/g.35448  ORF Transcript_16971/g.35448 Transcript_16971/m.35448 type:complete len:345 (-) Transcript_16971:22-1056(-)
MAPVTLMHSLKDLVDNFSPGGCYGIEWELSGDILKYKSHYNPQWRIDGVKAKGLHGLYTDRSSTYEFPVGTGFVGRTFAKQEVFFVRDLQQADGESIKDTMQFGDGTEFIRLALAQEFDLHSAIFLPLANGVVEVGSAAFVTFLPRCFAPFASSFTPPLAEEEAEAKTDASSTPACPLFLQKFVEELSGAGCYGIEWICESGVLKHRSHFNPQWRIEGVRKQGLKGLYTERSIDCTFAKGEGIVGAAFAAQAVVFIRDLRTVTSEEVKDCMQTGIPVAFLRAALAQEFGIHSAIFLPSADGVLEVGSTQTFDDLQSFLYRPAAAAIAGKSTAADIFDSLKALAA